MARRHVLPGTIRTAPFISDIGNAHLYTRFAGRSGWVFSGVKVGWCDLWYCSSISTQRTLSPKYTRVFLRMYENEISDLIREKGELEGIVIVQNSM